jgi:DNA polymerase sigma
MVQEQENFVQQGDGIRHHFDKQLIKEIVKAVERGCSRAELIRRYGMAVRNLYLPRSDVHLCVRLWKAG